ncbi:TPA: YfbU family protein [Providencia alcalifaciens]
MKISDGEKLIILMLNDLFRANNVKSEFDPDFLDEAIRDNHLWAIDWKYPGIEIDDNDTPDYVIDVVNYLDMWSFIEESYNRLTPSEITHFTELTPNFTSEPKFIGFDGNNESKYLTTAKFLINKLDRFTEFSGRYLNSHSRRISIYKRMLPIYEKERESNGFNFLNAESLARVINAQIHPSFHE